MTVGAAVENSQHAKHAGERAILDASPWRGQHARAWQSAIHNLLQPIHGRCVVERKVGNVEAGGHAREVAVVGRGVRGPKNGDIPLVAPEAPLRGRRLQLRPAP